MKEKILAKQLLNFKTGILFILILLSFIGFRIPSDLKNNHEVLFKKDSILYCFITTEKSINNLLKEFGDSYPQGDDYFKSLKNLKDEYFEVKNKNEHGNINKIYNDLLLLRKEAILNSPIIDFDEILLVKRKVNLHNWEKLDQKSKIFRFGFPSNHECNSSLQKDIYDDELAIITDLTRNEIVLKKVHKPNHRAYVGEVDLHWDAEKILFTESDSVSWKIKEMDLDSKQTRQVSNTPDDVDCFDATYLPNNKIVFGSTANYQSVPCWHGVRRVSNLYTMNNDGSEMRRLCYDQDHDFHPTILSNGQVLFNRWDYTGINHIYFRQQMVMNPDGTAQRAIYGSNSWFPNSLYFSREIPENPGKLISILSGYHGVPRMGQLVVIDTKKGWHEEKGLVTRISGKGEEITPKYYDDLVHADWPKFVTPYPLSDKYFLVSAWKKNTDNIGIYLADAFDNLILIKEIPGYALLEPIPVKKNKRPPVIPDKVRLADTDATVYIHNIYSGPGLKGVPKGTIEKIRVIAYNFGYYGMAGPDKIGYGGPWEAMQIVGTVPVENDGSAMFKVPANTPIAFQPIDRKGRAVQLMRSWVTAMPGEFMSCVGCHESPNEIAPSRLAMAALKNPVELTNWYGQPRGFDFAREVQPVLNKYCLDCHNGEKQSIPDLRAEEYFPDYKGKLLSNLGQDRLHPAVKPIVNGYQKYTPSYDALIGYIRRVSIEDEVNLLTPGEYHAGTSPLVQILEKGHHGVKLNEEAWERIYAWIDLNGPCHGTWNDAYPLQDGVDIRRLELSQLYGGPAGDPEIVYSDLHFDETPYVRKKNSKPTPLIIKDWPISTEEAKLKQKKLGEYEKTISLGDDVQLKLVKIPAGKYIIGDVKGQPDEWPQKEISIEKPFWMAECEVTNEHFNKFDPEHDSRFYGKRHARADDKGLPLNSPSQPVVRVSWEEASAFCEWLSKETGMNFKLPSEAQWEYACRAGCSKSLYYGEIEDDFSEWANLGDKSFGQKLFRSGGVTHMVLEGAFLADTTRNDNYVVTASVGSFKPNDWGLYDMHGNAAEWVSTSYSPYPYQEVDGFKNKVVRGGSFYDHPKRARSSYRLFYPKWQKVFNVGFRVVAEIE